MNNMTCSFANEEQLHQHIVEEKSSAQVAFLMKSDTSLRVLEQVSVRLNVDNVKATNKVLGRIVRRKPMMKATESDNQVWEYTVRLDPSDKVWFKAFVDEVETLSKFQSISP